MEAVSFATLNKNSNLCLLNEYLDRRNQSPKNSQKSQNFKTRQQYGVISCLSRIVRDSNFHSDSIFRYAQIVTKIFLGSIMFLSPSPPPCYTQKIKLKKQLFWPLQRKNGKIRVLRDFQVSRPLQGPNFHFDSVFRYDKIDIKNIFCYYTVP